MASLRLGLCYDPGVLQRPEYQRSLKKLDVIVFPELADGSYAALARGAVPHGYNDPLTHSFRNASRKFSFTCVAGSIYFKGGIHRPTNTSLVFIRGRLALKYDKIHLYRPTGDRKYFAKGKTVGTFNIPVRGGHAKGGVVVCYDLRFPELVRALAKRGLEVLFVPARWPAVRDDAWSTLLKARAIENQVFVVGCNALGREGGLSYVFDPLGRCVFSSRGKPATLLHTVRLDLRALVKSRSLHDNIKEAVLLRRNPSREEKERESA